MFDSLLLFSQFVTAVAQVTVHGAVVRIEQQYLVIVLFDTIPFSQPVIQIAEGDMCTHIIRINPDSMVELLTCPVYYAAFQQE